MDAARPRRGKGRRVEEPKGSDRDGGTGWFPSVVAGRGTVRGATPAVSRPIQGVKGRGTAASREGASSGGAERLRPRRGNRLVPPGKTREGVVHGARPLLPPRARSPGSRGAAG